MGRSYEGPWQGKFAQEGMEAPLVYWMPSIAASGLLVYTGDKFPSWKGNAFVGAMRVGRDSQHRSHAAHRVQRQGRGDTPREPADGAAPAHPRRAPGPRRLHLPADRRKPRPGAGSSSPALSRRTTNDQPRTTNHVRDASTRLVRRQGPLGRYPGRRPTRSAARARELRRLRAGRRPRRGSGRRRARAGALLGPADGSRPWPRQRGSIRCTRR